MNGNFRRSLKIEWKVRGKALYVSTQQPEARTQTQARPNKDDFPRLIDPSLLRAARQIYRSYYEVHPDLSGRPLGVAIHKAHYRGKLIFAGKPILLPDECFVPISQIESELL